MQSFCCVLRRHRCWRCCGWCRSWRRRRNFSFLGLQELFPVCQTLFLLLLGLSDLVLRLPVPRVALHRAARLGIQAAVQHRDGQVGLFRRFEKYLANSWRMFIVDHDLCDGPKLWAMFAEFSWTLQDKGCILKGIFLNKLVRLSKYN